MPVTRRTPTPAIQITWPITKRPPCPEVTFTVSTGEPLDDTTAEPAAGVSSPPKIMR